MKMIYGIIGLVIIVGILFYLKNNTAIAKEEQQRQQANPIKKTKVTENKYSEMRNMSLTVTPEQLQLKLESNQTIVYGINMDWAVTNGVATIVAFQTGDASMYLSGGQIYIGGFAHANVKNAGLAFVKEAQNYLTKAIKTESTALPDKNCIRFYLLTNHGKFSYQETVENIQNKSSEWTKLFALGNKVITEYRAIVDNK